MVIRKARLDDLESLLDIYNYEVLNGTATFDMHPKTYEERLDWFHGHNVENHPLIVAEADGRVVGYASLSPYRAKEAYKKTVELSVYISPEHRRRGIARRLICDILEEARQREDIHTVISVITSGNDASIHLHKEFGFTHCGTLKEVGEKFGKLLDVDNYQVLV